VVPIAEDEALSIGMLRYDRHLHSGPTALPGAARLPGLCTDEVRALGDARPVQPAHRPGVAVRAHPAPTPS
jgi:hypothetical protein